MQIQTAEIIYLGVMSVAVVVWVISLVLALRLGERPAEFGESWAPSKLPLDPSNPFQASWGHTDNYRSSEITGTQAVVGTPSDVSRALVKRIEETGIPGKFSSLFQITEQSSNRIAVTKSGPLICNQPSGLYFSDAVFDIHTTGTQQVRVDYRLGFDRLGNLLRKVALGIILGLGLPVLLIVGAVIWFYVVRNNNPVMRWQVLQSLQVCHALWPPFLIMFLYRAGRRHSRTYVNNLLRSVETNQA